MTHRVNSLRRARCQSLSAPPGSSAMGIGYAIDRVARQTAAVGHVRMLHALRVVGGPVTRLCWSGRHGKLRVAARLEWAVGSLSVDIEWPDSDLPSTAGHRGRGARRLLSSTLPPTRRRAPMAWHNPFRPAALRGHLRVPVGRRARRRGARSRRRPLRRQPAVMVATAPTASTAPATFSAAPRTRQPPPAPPQGALRRSPRCSIRIPSASAGHRLPRLTLQPSPPATILSSVARAAQEAQAKSAPQKQNPPDLAADP